MQNNFYLSKNGHFIQSLIDDIHTQSFIDLSLSALLFEKMHNELHKCLPHKNAKWIWGNLVFEKNQYIVKPSKQTNQY